MDSGGCADLLGVLRAIALDGQGRLRRHGGLLTLQETGIDAILGWLLGLLLS